MARSKYFKLYELVPKNLYDNLHEELLWSMLDENLVEMADKVKEAFPNGTMTINNYFWGGNREWSGIRTKASQWYSPTSQHSIGKAFDCIFSDYLVDDVRAYILAHSEEFPYITRIEEEVSWLHFDLKETGKSGIITFKG